MHMKLDHAVSRLGIGTFLFVDDPVHRLLSQPLGTA